MVSCPQERSAGASRDTPPWVLHSTPSKAENRWRGPPASLRRSKEARADIHQNHSSSGSCYRGPSISYRGQLQHEHSCSVGSESDGQTLLATLPAAHNACNGHLGAHHDRNNHTSTACRVPGVLRFLLLKYTLRPRAQFGSLPFDPRAESLLTSLNSLKVHLARGLHSRGPR